MDVQFNQNTINVFNYSSGWRFILPYAVIGEHCWSATFHVSFFQSRNVAVFCKLFRLGIRNHGWTVSLPASSPSTVPILSWPKQYHSTPTMVPVLLFHRLCSFLCIALHSDCTDIQYLAPTRPILVRCLPMSLRGCCEWKCCFSFSHLSMRIFPYLFTWF